MSKEHAYAFECGYQMGLAHGRTEHESIIRCRDCRYCKLLGGVLPECWAWREPHRVTFDSFCSFGEKRVQE